MSRNSTVFSLEISTVLCQDPPQEADIEQKEAPASVFRDNIERQEDWDYIRLA